MATTEKTASGQEVKVLDPATGEVEVLDRVGLPSAADYGMQSRVSDLIPTPEAWIEYPQAKVEDIIDLDQIILDVMFFPSQDFPGSEWSIILLQDPITKSVYTTSCGGSVLLRKLHHLKEMERADGSVGALPIVGRILQKESRTKGYHDYYDLV